MTAIVRVLSAALPVLALVVIVFGAYVRLSDAGLGCPDWPGCYGRLTVPSQSDVARENPSWQQRPLQTGKAWREMIHRYLASTLGLGIVVLALSSWRYRHIRRPSKVVYVLVPLVMFQGLLGMWTVTLLLKPLIVCAHLLGGLATLALLWWNFLTVAGAQRVALPRSNLRLVACLGLVVLVGQIALGGWTSANYAALACTDFPTCHGRWWPNANFDEAFVLWRGLGVDYEFGVLDTPARTAIHVSHRIGAVVTTVVLSALVLLSFLTQRPRLRLIGWCILGVLTTQLALGITNVLGGLPLPVAVLHNAGAASLMLTLVSLIYTTARAEVEPNHV